MRKTEMVAANFRHKVLMIGGIRMSTESMPEPTYMPKNSSSKPKWPRNYSRVMPYYYVNHRARLRTANGEEKTVRVRQMYKNVDELVIEVVEKERTKRKGKIKTKSEETLTADWDSLEEISLKCLSTPKWRLQFLN